MNQTTLDVKYTELLQWLKERNLIPKDWPSRLEIIKTKKQEIFDTLYAQTSQEMQKIQKSFTPLRALPIESICYNDYAKLYQQLTKTTEAKDKTLFGRYNSPLIYNAYILDNVYLKDNMHLAENAKIILQNIHYDIPTCKKLINDLKNTINEHEYKSQEKRTQITLNKEKIETMLKSYDIKCEIENITPNDIASNLIERFTKDDVFEQLLTAIENSIKNNSIISKAIDMYVEFNNIVLQNTNTVTSNELLPQLSKFIIKGDFLLKDTNTNTRKEMIEFKSKQYKMKYTEQEDISQYKFALVDDNNNNNNNTNNLISLHSQITSSTNDTKVNSEEPCDTCLLNTSMRNLLIADLTEVLIFLSERLSHSNSKEEINLTMYNQELKQFNLKYSSDDFNNCIEYIQQTLKLMEDKKFISICDLFNDDNNIKRIIDLINDIKVQNSKLNNVIEGYVKKNAEIQNEIKEHEKKMNDFKKEAIKIRKATEVFLTKKLQRKINVMGDENLIAK